MEEDRRASRRRASASADPRSAQGEASRPAPAEDGVETAAAEDARLQIRLRSDAPRGTVTLYAGEERVLQESFDFYERRWWGRRVPHGGVLEASVGIAAGPRVLQVLVTRHQERAEGVQREAVFEEGETYELAIDLPEKGEPTVVLR